MESVKAREFKDRFIKGSISTLQEEFNTKWEITDAKDCICFMKDESDKFSELNGK